MLNFGNKTKKQIEDEMNHYLEGWRTKLSDYETQQLIPLVKERITSFLGYFARIEEQCSQLAEDQIFVAQLATLLTKAGEELPRPMLRQAAASYYRQIGRMVAENYVAPANRILERIDGVTDYPSLAACLNEVNWLCSTITVMKEKVFLFRLKGFFALRDLSSGQVVTSEPTELAIFFMPFQALLENLQSEATALSGSIYQWHKEQLNWKTAFLEAVNAGLQIRNTKWLFLFNVATVFVAVVLSFVFMTASDPYKNALTEEQNKQLHTQLNAALRDVGSRDIQLKQVTEQLKERDELVRKVSAELELFKKKPSKPRIQKTL